MNYKSHSDTELFRRVDELRNLANGLSHLLNDPTTGEHLGLPLWAEQVVKHELLETRPLLAELQYRGYGTDVK